MCVPGPLTPAEPLVHVRHPHKHQPASTTPLPAPGRGRRVKANRLRRGSLILHKHTDGSRPHIRHNPCRPPSSPHLPPHLLLQLLSQNATIYVGGAALCLSQAVCDPEAGVAFCGGRRKGRNTITHPGLRSASTLPGVTWTTMLLC